MIEDNLFIEDLTIAEENLLSIDDLSASKRKVLQESIDILKKVDFIKNDYVSIDNIKVSTEYY
ncbi:hypothetical protein [Clostridium sp. JN-1]|uniref:hypothetical protein n=1 Tax=Clostridium sp. JN-1 TaxID=2483110 RepID=UPI000F0B2969|nr:hypothetical protein [Clostridium sp. JN-1]